MRTESTNPPKLPPAWFKHLFWRCHRTLHQVNGGRFLWTPDSWARWAEIDVGLDELAGRRSVETPVVVLEPRTS